MTKYFYFQDCVAFVSFLRNKDLKINVSFYDKTCFDVLLSIINVLQSWEYKHNFFSVMYYTEINVNLP